MFRHMCLGFSLLLCSCFVLGFGCWANWRSTVSAFSRVGAALSVFGSAIIRSTVPVLSNGLIGRSFSVSTFTRLGGELIYF